MDAIYNFDYAVMNWIQDNLRSGFADGFMTFITHLGDAGIFWIAIAVIMLCFRRTRKIGCVMGLALLSGVIIGNLTLKPLIARVRPYENSEYIELIRVTKDMLLIKAPHDFSFPSGHTLASFEAAVGIFVCNKKWGIPAIIVAALVAFSRIYLYVHYLTDVIGGIVIGTCLAIAAYYVVNALEPKVIAAVERRKSQKTAE